MTNPTLEQRAREILAQEYEATAPAGKYAARDIRNGILSADNERAIRAMLTFSHTAVEQAIEACAKVCDDDAATCEPLMNGVGYGPITERNRYRAMKAAAERIRALPDTLPLPAQSPDDIAYAGAVQGDSEVTDRVYLTIASGRLVSFATDRGGAFPIMVRSASPAPSPVNVEGLVEWPADAQFHLGDAVAKKGRASWRGHVRGWYRTELTALGYAIESMYEPGSVQIYPESALASLSPDGER